MSQRRWETLDCEEQEEKEQLLEEGFSTWSWRDCNTFIKASEKYCQHEIEGKTSEEVERYAKVFKERYKELNVWRKMRACEELFNSLLDGITQITIARGG